METPIIALPFIFQPVILLVRSFEPYYLIGILVILLLLGLSALFSGSETAYFSLNPSQKLELKKNKKYSARKAEEILMKPKHLLATLLIANNFVNIAIVIISTVFANHIFDFSEMEWLGFLFKVVFITGMILLIGEILPKVYASYNPLKIVLLSAIPLTLFIRICYPINFILIRTTSLIEKKMHTHKKGIDINELSDAIDITSQQS